MKLEQQVCSLELAQKLKELGVKQEINHGDYAWVGNELHLVHNDNDTGWLLGNDYLTYFREDDTGKVAEYVKSFTVSDLGEMLPYEVYVKDKENEHQGQFYYWHTGKANADTVELGLNHWMYKYENAHISLPVDFLCIGTADTEADARAKMLIYLLENNLKEIV